MRLTEQLLKEHEAIKHMLEIMEVVCKKLENDETVKSEDLVSIMKFINVFTHQIHHSKEEDLLLPAIVDADIQKQDDSVDDILADHSLGSEYINDLGDAIRLYNIGGKQAVSRIIINASAYITLLRQHIIKEDDILFPLADEHLSPDKQDELIKEYEKINGEKHDSKEYSDFYKLIDDLRKEYLIN